MNDTKRNIAISVNTRLKNLAKKNNENVQFVFERYCIERLLYRLSVSDYKENFVLKGGALFLAWRGKSYRVTRDLDLLGYGSHEPGELESIFRTICSLEVPEDGVIFDPETVKASEIRADAKYAGVRIEIEAKLDRAKLKIQVDIGFGDVVTPEAQPLVYPTLLDMPAPEILAYTVYTVIAEKFEAMVKLDIANSRLKDFYDLWLISRLYTLDGKTLQHAVEKTFTRRGSSLVDPITAFTEAFYGDDSKQKQWQRFTADNLETFGEKLTLERVIQELTNFLLPVVVAIHTHQTFNLQWSLEERTWIEV